MATKPNNQTTNAQTKQEPEGNKNITTNAQAGMSKKTLNELSGQFGMIAEKYNLKEKWAEQDARAKKEAAVKKLIPNTIEQIDKEYRGYLEQHETLKRTIIQTYAKDLETKGKMPIDKICQHITEKLKEFCDERYVRMCLGPKYKNESMSKNASLQNNASVGGNITANTKQSKKKEEPEIEMRPEESNTPMKETTKKQEETEDTETKGRENIKRENAVNFNNYFEITHNSKPLKISVEKVKQYPKEVLEQMVGHLIGVAEHLQRELEQSLKKVEELRKELKEVTQKKDHFEKTIDEHIALQAQKDKKIESLEKKLKDHKVK